MAFLINGHELGQAPGDAKGRGDLPCCDQWGCKELDMTWQLNNNKKLGLRIGRLCSYFIWSHGEF